MRFELSEEQEMIRDSTAEFLASRCPLSRVRTLMETETAFDPELWTALAQQRYIGALLPDSVGGMDLTPVELAVLAEEMGRACMPGPFLATVWGAAILQAAGTDAQKSRLLPAVAQGRVKLAVVRLEEAARGLSGRTPFVLNANVADTLLVATRDSVAALISRDAPGVTVRHTPGIDRTRPLCEVTFDDVRVPDGDLLRLPAAAWEEAASIATVAACADMVGGMRWMLEATLEHARRREQFGKTIGSFQAVQHMAADMLMGLEGARSATYYAAWALSRSEPDAARAVSVAKAFVSDAAREVGNRACQIHGGIGFTWEHDLHVFYRRAKLSEHLFGDATHHRERIARAMLDESP